MTPNVIVDRRSRHRQQRTQQPCFAAARKRALARHAGEAAQTRAAQQVVQHRFRLIAPMMGECDPIGIERSEGGVARRARRRFDALPARPIDGDTRTLQRYRHRVAQSRAEIGPAIGVAAEAMMNMQGG